MTDRAVRWAGIAGIVFVIAVVITIVAGGSMPAPDASTDEIRRYFVDHRSGLLISNFLGLVATPFVLWFGVALRQQFRRDAMSTVLGTTALAGLILTAAMATVGGVLQAAPVYVDGAANHTSADVLRLLFDAQALSFGATAGGMFLFAACSAFAIRRTGALPTYVMWLATLNALGAVLAAFSVLAPGAFALGFVGVTTLLLFVLVAGVTMATGKVTSPAA